MADATPESVPVRRLPNVLLAVMVALAVLALVAQVVRQLGMDVPYDFEVYWNVGRMLGSGDADLYGWQEGRNEWVYLYPPFFAAAFVPLSHLNLQLACGLWMAAQIPLLGVCLLGLFKLVGAESARSRVLVAASVLVPLFMAFHRNIGWGQVNLVILALCAWGLHAALSRKQHAAGVALATGAHLKLMPVALLPVLLILGRFRAAVLMSLVGCLLVFAPAVWLMPRLGVLQGASRAVALNVEYAGVMLAPRAMSRDAAGMGPESGNNLAPSALLGRANRGLGAPFPAGVAKWAGATPGFVLYAVALLLAWRRRDPALAAGLSLVAAVLAQVTVWHYHLVLMAVPLAAFAMLHERARVPRWVLPTLCSGLVLLFDFTLSDRLPLLTQLREAGVTLGGLLGASGLMAWFGWRAKAPAIP